MADRIPGPLGRPRSMRSYWLRNLQPAGVLLQMSLPRLLDLGVALLLLGALAPLLLLRALAAQWQSGRVLERRVRLGRLRTPFEQLRFAGTWPGGRSALLLNLLRGDISLVGPRALTADEVAGLPLSAQARFDVRPGLISSYRLRQGTGIAYESEAASDTEMAYAESFKGHVGLLLRGTAVSVLKGGERPTPALLDFFGVPIVNTTMEEAVDWILEQARGARSQQLAFVNPDCLNIAYKHEAYHQVLCRAARVLPDGIGIHIGCRMLGSSLMANVNGTDLFPRLCAALEDRQDLSIFLLGAQPGIAELTASNMQQRFPQLRIAGTQHGFFSETQQAEVIDRINASGANILLVAFGAPRQELWIAEQLAQLEPRVVMGVGGLFDFYSGRISRAPQWLRELGLEWTWRLLQEPGRMWRRYVIGNPLFLYRVWRQSRQSASPR